MNFYEALHEIAGVIPEIRKTIRHTNKKFMLEPLALIKGRVTTTYNENYCTVGIVGHAGEIYDLFTFYTQINPDNKDESIIADKYGLFSYTKGTEVEIPIEDEESMHDINIFYNPDRKQLYFADGELTDYSYNFESPDEAESIMFALSTVQDNIGSPDILKQAHQVMKLFDSVLKPNECIDCVEGFNEQFKKNWSKNVLYPRLSFD